MQHSSLVLLPPLLPFMGGPMPDLNIPIHVLVGLVVDPNAELVHVWSSGHSVSGVKLQQVGVQPLHLLQHVPIGGGGWGAVIREPAELWCVQQGGHSKGVLNGWMVFCGLPLHQISEISELGEQLLHLVPLQEVVQACHYQYIDTSSLLLVLQAEGLLQVLHLATRDSHIVNMDIVTLVLELLLLAWPGWGWCKGKELVQGRVREAQLDPICGVLVVDLLAGGAEAVASRVCGDRLHEPGGEMLVVHGACFLCHWLPVRTDTALWFT